MVLAICKVVGPKAASNEWLVVPVVPSVVRGSEAALFLFFFSFFLAGWCFINYNAAFPQICAAATEERRKDSTKNNVIYYEF